MGDRKIFIMGRRKIDIAYLTDDRVRKVTFCKRKGGLFKKADDLSKLCGVEIAVIIVGEKKTCEYASTDMNRILEKYQTMQAGTAPALEESETSRLWAQLEAQRRELEALTRELAARDAMLQQQQSLAMTTMPPLAPSQGLLLPKIEDVQPVAQSLPESTAQTIVAPQETVTGDSKKRGADIAELSDDTAEVEGEDSSAASDVEEREAKRVRHEASVLVPNVPVVDKVTPVTVEVVN